MSTPGARATDPDTSHTAATSDRRADDRAVRERLLIEWYREGADGLTDQEAADRAGLTHRTYWKRAGELRQPNRAGTTWSAQVGAPLIAFHPDGLTRRSVETATPRKVSVITARGIDYVRTRGLLPDDPADLHTEIARLHAVVNRAIDVAADGTRQAVIDVLREA